MTPRPSERGAALLTVLLLVAVMAVIAATMLDRLNLATRLAANSQAMAQARYYAVSAESFATARLASLVNANRERTVDPQHLLGREFAIPFAAGNVAIRIDDAGNCFNLNSVVEGEDGNYVLRPSGLAQLRALMVSLAIPENEAIPLSDAIADWIDSNDIPAPNGTEDDYYQSLPTPYRTAGRLIVDPSELRAIRGMTPAYYTRLRPWVCALPGPELSPLNVNTLRPDQARLLAMLAPGTIDLRRAQALIAARPALGFARAADFVGPIGGLSSEAAGQLQVTSRWFLLDLQTSVDSIRLDEQALVDVGVQPARVVSRSWGDAETR